MDGSVSSCATVFVPRSFISSPTRLMSGREANGGYKFTNTRSMPALSTPSLR